MLRWISGKISAYLTPLGQCAYLEKVVKDERNRVRDLETRIKKLEELNSVLQADRDQAKELVTSMQQNLLIQQSLYQQLEAQKKCQHDRHESFQWAVSKLIADAQEAIKRTLPHDPV